MAGRARHWDAIILAGGRAERLDGTAKPELVIGDATLLERTVSAVSGATRIVLAGNVTANGCTTVLEAEPFGGPVAGIAAALPETESERILIVACDHPFLAPAVSTLVTADPGRDGVVAVDSTGRQQLLTCLDRAALASALAVFDNPAGVSMRQLLAGLEVREIVVDDRAAFDIDTWDDVDRGRELNDQNEVAEHD